MRGSKLDFEKELKWSFKAIYRNLHNHNISIVKYL
jgi:hypothetical protein